MIRWLTSAWTVALALMVVVQLSAGQTATVDVTGAWTVTITLASGERVSGLAILSQDGNTITGMIGPGETEMMPVEGTVEGNAVTLRPRPRAGRTAAFATSDLAATTATMTGTIDRDKGTIALTRKPRPSPPAR